MSSFYEANDFYARELMKPPERASKFGDDALVYSEISARVMVIDAYERGLEDAQNKIED